MQPEPTVHPRGPGVRVVLGARRQLARGAHGCPRSRLDCNGTAEITAEAETDTENKQNYVFFAPKEIHTEGPA